MKLPSEIPIFPLEKCVLMPGCNLPLQLFEPRYIQMFHDMVASGQKHIGMIQPKDPLDHDNLELFKIGTLGLLIDAVELPEQRILITLQGIQRFKIIKELPNPQKLYRLASVDYKSFLSDNVAAPIELSRKELVKLTSSYVKQLELEMDTHTLDKLSEDQLVNVISQILPFSMIEKQTLLEAKDTQERSETLVTLLRMATANLGVTSTDQDPVTN